MNLPEFTTKIYYAQRGLCMFVWTFPSGEVKEFWIIGMEIAG